MSVLRSLLLSVTAVIFLYSPLDRMDSAVHVVNTLIRNRFPSVLPESQTSSSVFLKADHETRDPGQPKSAGLCNRAKRCLITFAGMFFLVVAGPNLAAAEDMAARIAALRKSLPPAEG